MANSCRSKALDFFMIIGQLKKIKRTGWVYRKVPDPERVAGHMYRMAIMSFLLEDKTLNRDRCLKLSLVHDMAESIVGDIAPDDGISKEEKYRREKEALDKLQGLVSEEVGTEIGSLWEEYTNQATPEAKAVKDFDRFDMILQAHEYEQDEPERGAYLQEFFDSTQGKFQTPQVVEWTEELYKRRNNTAEEKSELQS
ncbi:5'-deoxynucleotidase HDDC2-like [Lineus longissimus]|uniref:5'-deoxynucleotidase HDDC2-like n=1 Tax=Lineus longissimus TaxID=88925 RepID=UPI002B4E4946